MPASTGPNTSRPTGTQGVVGNPFCDPPHEIIGGKDVTPLNWSCRTTQQPAVVPRNLTVARPGPPVPAGAANPCQPGGPGGYNFLDNPAGTQLPPGCVRPAAGNTRSKTIAKTDPRYDTAPLNGNRSAPSAAPGSYLQSEGKPGDYLQPSGLPGSYLGSTSGEENRAQENSGQNDGQPQSKKANYQTAPRSKTDSNPRQDLQSMQPSFPESLTSGSTPASHSSQGAHQKSAVAANSAKKTIAASKSTSATDAQTVSNAKTIINGIVHVLGTEPR